MWQIIKTFITTNILRIAAYVLASISIIGLLFNVRQSGKNAERVANLEKQSKDVRKSHDIEDKNRASLRDGDASERLRHEWSRDE